MRIDPHTLAESYLKFGYNSPVLVGGRYLVTRVWAANGKGVQLRWQDLLDPESAVHLSANDVNGDIVPIDGANAFYVASHSGSPITQLRLYSMSGDGAKFVCEWLPLGSSQARDQWEVQSKEGLIASLSADASHIEVRDATQGNLLNSFAAPTSPGFSQRAYWRLDRGAMVVGSHERTYELLHGALIPANGVADQMTRIGLPIALTKGIRIWEYHGVA